jgi:hypothetical protein
MAGRAEPEEIFIARQCLGKPVPVATDTYTRI